MVNVNQTNTQDKNLKSIIFNLRIEHSYWLVTLHNLYIIDDTL